MGSQPLLEWCRLGVHAPHRPTYSFAKNVFQQFYVLLKRNYLNNLRNPGIVWIRLFM